MKNSLYILLYVLLLPAICGCEKVLYYNDDTENLVINGIACTDTTFMLSVAKSYNYWQMEKLPAMDFYRYEMRYRYNSEPGYTGNAVLDDAKVLLAINGSDPVPLRYSHSSFAYTCAYSPKPGDKLKVSIEAENYNAAGAEVQIPHPAHLDFVSVEKKYSKNTYNGPDSFSDSGATDTVAVITLKITDPGAEKNFYRLKVRGYSHNSNEGNQFVTDIFASDDVIFRDEQLSEPYRGWPANFSNIFTDQLFNGKEYVFTVESRLRSNIASQIKENTIVVELQTITKELYHYIKSTMLYRITDQDAYTEPIIIAGNIKDGLGILGGASTSRHVIHL